MSIGTLDDNDDRILIKSQSMDKKNMEIENDEQRSVGSPTYGSNNGGKDFFGLPTNGENLLQAPSLNAKLIRRNTSALLDFEEICKQF